MRLIILVLISVFLTNCEDSKSSKQKTVPVKDSVKLKKPIEKTLKDTVVTPKRTYPLLTDKNAMDFFLEYNKEHKENKVRIKTDFGDIEILLFKETKFHRSNFIFLTKQNYFDNTQFYRIVNNFIIQGGNSDNRKVLNKRKKIGKYLLPTDTKRGFKHVRGVISMPSSEIENPHKLASPYEFFIVQAKNGAPHLDGDFTIFGKVTKGMNVVDEIAKQKTDKAEWPLHNVYIRKVEIIE
ncbi:MAG: peptidylprolyl isomerase [Bacteroidetes bacterium MedPE-SWsnd-G2]|nr:MAG: peptidylprolyl isomerase [Bacteroidetes bacterium MedPE-SWsnd-G2]